MLGDDDDDKLSHTADGVKSGKVFRPILEQNVELIATSFFSPPCISALIPIQHIKKW